MIRMQVQVWHLEQRLPSDLRNVPDPPVSTSLVRQLRTSPALARCLYRTVGADWNWRSRRDWDDLQWEHVLQQPETEIWLSWHRDRLTGYAELGGGLGERHTTSKIRYLGLLPGECGHRFGAQLVADATRRAWTMHHRVRGLPPVERVVVNTSGNDGRYARHTYVSRGFRLIDVKLVERPAPAAAS